MAPRGSSRQIADELRRQIDSGDLPPGSMLPSEQGLARQYSVSRGTARSALAALADAGLVEVVPGLGRRIVGEAHARPAATEWEKVAASLRELLSSTARDRSAPLPSESVIAAKFGVSRNTVRRAYRELVDEGLVVIRHGAGAFAAPR